MLKHPILIAILLVALATAGCVAGQPVSPDEMAAVAPTVAGVVSQLVPQLAGTYTVEASDGAGNSHELSLKLSPDGSVELVTELADATQLMESGTWLLSGEGDVVISLGTTEGQSIVEPRTIRLAVEGDELVATDSVTGGQLRLAPGMMGESPTAEPTAVAPAEPTDETPVAQSLTFVSSQPAADSPGLDRSLTFYEDGRVTLTSDYLNDQPPIVEEGTWAGNADGTVTVTLTGQQGGQPYATPVVITFGMQDGSLVAVDYDTSLYGSEGLTMQPEAPAAENTPEAASAPGDETVGQDTEALFRTFLSLQPAADGSAILRSLALGEDFTATMTSDYYNDEPVVVEEGTWTADSDTQLTVTLTGQRGGQLYLSPVVITFTLDGDTLTATDYDTSIYGAEGLTMRLAANVAGDENAALVTLDLQAGFPLDPTFVSVNGGGDLNAAVIDPECAGYVNRQPVVTVNWTGEAEFVEAFFVSDDDPTLVVLAPDGQVYCNDDANDQLMDPVVEVANPLPGQYRIWIGSYARNQLIPGILVLTTNPDVNLGTFDLGSFIKRPPVPEVLETPEPAVDLEAIMAAVESRLAKTQLQKLGAPAGAIQITAEGTIPAFQLPLDDPACNGLVNEAPDHVFEWAGATDALNVYFEGDGDATLLVMGPDQSVTCSDDAADTGNLNPQVILSNPAAGTYAVWVGRVSPDAPVAGTLTITGDSSALPAMLEAGQ
ncbi:MAG: copper resistance protein NlpE N-terminal domain-containing protein [Caldilineales bacterium]